MQSLGLNLRPHRHSGRPLPHRHTSYGALAILLVLGGLVMALLNLAIYNSATANTQSASGSISVSGQVSGPSPAAAPTIIDPVNDQHFGHARIIVTGNCLPSMLVVVASNGLDRGSVVCASDGTFELQLDLFVGRNDLVARQYDSLNQVSPSSNTVRVYFNNATGERPPESSTDRGLLISSDYRYVGAAAGSKLHLKVNLQGGKPPYAIGLNWGDDLQDLVSRQEAGEVLFDHVYANPGVYTIKLNVTDAAGATSYFQTVAYISGPVASATQAISPEGSLAVAWPVFGLVGLVVLSFWLGEIYDRKRWQRLGRDAPPS